LFEIDNLSLFLVEDKSSVLSLELFLSQIRELVKSDGVGDSGQRFSLHSQVVLEENLQSVVVFVWRVVNLSVLQLPLVEDSLDVLWDIFGTVVLDVVESRSDEESCGSNNDKSFVHFIFYKHCWISDIY
jgi:hypothetical protein